MTPVQKKMTPKQTVIEFRALLDSKEVATIYKAATIRSGTEIIYIPMKSKGRVVVLVGYSRYECLIESDYFDRHLSFETTNPEEAISYILKLLERS